MGTKPKSKKSSSKALVKVAERVYERPKSSKSPKRPKDLPPQKEYRVCSRLSGDNPARLPKIKVAQARGKAEAKAHTPKRLKTKPKRVTKKAAEFEPERGSGVRSLPAAHKPTPKSRYLAYIRGFSQGASGRRRAESDKDFADYLTGYEEGMAARDAASDAYANDVGYRPIILKVQDL
jgi:hypothetical protein